MKKRITQHSGRTQASRKHNDRNFDIEKATHINAEKTAENVYFKWCDNVKELRDLNLTFEQAELLYYEKVFGKAIRKRNEKYIKSGHPEKARSVSDIYYKNKLKQPEELILQIGNIKNKVTKKVFRKCLRDYLKILLNWNKKHGEPFAILDAAEHHDEATLHAHIRRVWQYKNDDGDYEIGQNEALKRAGIKPPNPEKKIDRFNNRKVTFDKIMRKMWLRVCKINGVDVEEEPQVSKKHLDKEDYIRQKIEDEKIEAEKQLEKAKKERVAQAQLARNIFYDILYSTDKKKRQEALKKAEMYIKSADKMKNEVYAKK